MSFGGGNGGYQGGRTRMGTKVFLNIYDLSPANDFLYPIGFGFHHAGVECLGTEYSFASNAGVFESSPKEAGGAKFREQVFMGHFDGGQMELKKAIDDVKEGFGPNDYNIVRKNCNHFANALVHRLLGTPIPGYVNRIADVGACCACLLPKQMLESAPVGDPDAAAQNGGFGTNSGIIARGPSAPQAKSIRAFEGTGYSLGGTTSTSSSSGESSSGGLMGSLLGSSGASNGNTTSTSGSNTKGADDLTDRREKARKAALARMEKQQQQNIVSNESKDK